ncbi:hypothetical protein N7E81_17735 [Reichenbachiella carrageenanivorans]|uniref:Uncharacterized protein n=1 Tax=Reichenbachiella carrageenanivorans TaxID=2979869 RepID=A0ABY6D2A0_9BACT|nr:hypothetical protein [Reichenbachiella carrageenanivorans]UXX79198.1 hypothetical protein N7E81_17735 [Reichenbachiella carrageenanivorans]
MSKTQEKYYLKILSDKDYNHSVVELKFQKLEIDLSKYNLFQVKSAISYLSRYEDEIDSIIINANQNIDIILNAATVKQERSKN